MGKSRSRKPRNSATFRLCPRPGAADASDRVLVRVDGNPYYLPGFADGEDEGAFPQSSSYYEDDRCYSSSSGTADDALPEHVRREILELGLPDDGYNYLTHIREFRPSFSSTGGVGSSAAFIPSRRTPRRPLSVKAYDARSVEVGTDNVAAAAVVTTIEEAVDPDVTKLLEEEGDVTQGTSEEDEESEEDEALKEDDEFEEEDEELEEDFVIIANQPEEEEQGDLEDEWFILGEEEQMPTKEMLSL